VQHIDLPTARMFSSFNPTVNPTFRARTNPYQKAAAEIGVAGADPHALITMLFDGLATAVAEARGALRRGETADKCAAISRAVRIVDEGLRAALDMRAGGALAQDLADLYDYVSRRLTEANLRNDESMLDECLQLMHPVHEAWLAITPRTTRQGST
jgi:flagellar protein FliS